MERLKYGIVGVGNRGRGLVRAACATGEVDVVAFADPHDASKREARGLLPDARAYGTWEELLDRERLDALLVATPNHAHTDVVLAALDAGLHVLSEKPLAPTLEECDRIIKRAATARGVLQVGLELRFHPVFRDVKSMVEQGAIGTPKMLWCHEFRPPFLPGVGGWRLRQEASGGSLLEKNCHHFDLFNWIAGSRPVRVMAAGSSDTLYAEQGILDRAWVIVEYENGLQANLGLCLFYHGAELRIGVLGTAGGIEGTVDPDMQQLALTTETGTSVRPYQARRQGSDHGGEVEQQVAFIRSIRTGEPPVTDAAAAKWSQVVSLAAEEAVRSGRVVGIDPDGSL